MPKVKFTHDDFDSAVLKQIDMPLQGVNGLARLKQAAGIPPTTTPGIPTPSVKLPRIPKI